MGSLPFTRRRTLLAALVGAVLLGVGSLAWIAFGSRGLAPGIVSEPEVSASGSTPREEPAALESIRSPHSGEVDASPLEPVPPGRSQLGGEPGPQQRIDVLVRTRDEGTPMPGCEVIFIRGGGEDEGEIAQTWSRRGFDLGEARRIGQRTRTDENGHVLLPGASEGIYALAISESHCGLESFDTDPESTEERTIDCAPMWFLRARVVDERNRPRAGIPLCVSKKREGPLDFELAGTTRGPDGIAELGPIERADDDVLIVRVAGAFPLSTSVEVDPGALPAQPIQLVLPAHGSLEVRLLHADGSRFAGTAEVRLESIPSGPELAAPPPEALAIRSGSALFPYVGLGLELQAKVVVPGRDPPYRVHGHGPRSAGEKAVLEVKLDPGGLTLVARVLDSEQRPLRFCDLQFIGAVELPGAARQFDEQATTDSVGNCAITLTDCEVAGAAATLLIVCKREPSLGALRSIVLESPTNDLGTWALKPTELLARGRVVEADGVNSVSGASVELVNPDRDLGIGWAEPSKSGERGQFELRGWSSEATISILAGTPGARLREPIAVARGSIDVVLPRAGAKSR